MATIAEIRQAHPEYNDMSDQQLADALHKKFYSDMPIDQFYSKVGMSVAPPEKQPQESAGFVDNMKADIAKRKAQSIEIQSNPNISTPSKYLQLYGNVGGGIINDAASNALSSASDAYAKIPDYVLPPQLSLARKASDAIEKNAGSSIGKSGPVNYIVDRYKEAAVKYPEIVGDIEAAGNLLGVATMANPAREAATSTTKAAINTARATPKAMASVGEKSLAKQAAKEAAANREMRYKILVDDTNKAGKETISDKSSLKSKLSNIKYSESAVDKKMLDATDDLPLKLSNPITMNKTIVQEANDKLRADIVGYLEKNSKIVNPVDIRIALKDAKKSVDSVGYIGADENSKAVQSVFEKARELTKNVNNSNDLFKARQAFDNWAKAQKNENSLFGDGLDNSVRESVNQIRRNMNDLIEKSIPDSQYKALMKKHSGLIEAEQVLTKKAVGEAPTAVGRYMSKAKSAVDKLGVPLSVASATGLTALTAAAPQLVAAGLAGYGAYKGGKALSKAAMKAAAKSSVKIGKALSPAEKAVAAKPSIPTGGKQLLLEGPKKSASQVPLTERQIKMAQAKIRQKVSEPIISGSAIKISPTPDQVPPKLLTGPKPDIKVSPSGKAIPQSGAEMTAAYEKRKSLNDIGMTGDVRRLISQKEMRETVGKDWDKLSANQKDLIQKQVNEAWKNNKVPIEKIIEAAKINAIRLASAKNEVLKPNAMSDALLNAKPLKNRAKSDSIPNTKNPLTEK